LRERKELTVIPGPQVVAWEDGENRRSHPRGRRGEMMYSVV
jgi:hypothetical protein